MKKNSKMFMGIAICIIFLEGFVFYLVEQNFVVDSIFLALQNTIKSITLDASLLPNQLFNNQILNLNGVYLIRGILYLISLVASPLLSIIILFEYVQLFINHKYKKSKEHVLIFGFNENSKKIIKNNKKDITFYIVTNMQLKKEERLELFKGNCIIINIDSIQEFSTSMIYKIKKLDYIEKILLLEENQFSNLQILSELTTDVKFKNKNFYCSYDSLEIMDLMIDFTNDQNLNIQYFNINQLAVHNVLSENPIPISNNETTHILFFGINHLGVEAIKQALNQGVTSSKNKIILSIVENGAERENILNLFSIDFINNNYYNDNLDGKLCIDFYDIKTPNIELLQTISQKDEISYIFVCGNDNDINIKFALAAKDFILQNYNEKITIAMQLNNNQILAENIRINQKSLSNITIIRSKEEIMDLDIICNLKIENQEMEFNYLYQNLLNAFVNSLYDGDLKEIPPKDELWKNTDYYSMSSSRFGSYHNEVKKRILGENYKDILHEKLTKVFGIDNLDKLITNKKVKIDAKEVVENLHKDKELLSLLELEHRRWNFFVVCLGWKRTTGKKNPSKKQTPYLINYNELCEKYPDIACYDFIPYIMLLQEI